MTFICLTIVLCASSDDDIYITKIRENIFYSFKTADTISILELERRTIP